MKYFLVSLAMAFLAQSSWATPKGKHAIPSAPSHPLAGAAASVLPGSGIRFTGTAPEIARVKREMMDLLREYGLDAGLVSMRQSGNSVDYTLKTPPEDTSTLDLQSRPEYKIKPEQYTFRDPRGKQITVPVVSKKEILVALLQHGRLTTFEGAECSVEALRDAIGIRQNTARWAMRLQVSFPEKDGRKKGNPKFWTEEMTVKPGVRVHEAVADAFLTPGVYRFACQRTSRLIIRQGFLDYYANVKKDPKTLERIEAAMKNDPFGEPGGAFTAESKGVAWNNWIAGDWGFFRNKDYASSETFGLEGSNTVYIGRGLFGNYDPTAHNSLLTFRDKVEEVYNWRFGVEDWRKDPKARHLTDAELRALSLPGDYFKRERDSAFVGPWRWYANLATGLNVNLAPGQ